ncbi:MAG: hypothetical protein VX600_04010, partial [Candidatus Neomarinimicrobiota bacterium]|nr:hypothetical protein [Candidatus Neomarinimicrobiota bacterium]
AEDASRTDLSFLVEVGQLVHKSGADRFSLADTVGCLTPTKTKNLVGQIVSEIDLPIHVHCHNDFGMATANALSALEAGAQCVDVTVNGLGERCGLPTLAEVTVALNELHKVDHNWNLELLPELSELVGSFTNLESKFNRPIVGRNAFTHKAGLHVKAVAENPRSYEAISPESVYRNRRFIIDKYTGSSALKNKFEQLGITLSRKELDIVLKKIKSHPEKVSWAGKELINLTKSIGIKT